MLCSDLAGEKLEGMQLLWGCRDLGQQVPPVTAGLAAPCPVGSPVQGHGPTSGTLPGDGQPVVGSVQAPSLCLSQAQAVPRVCRWSSPHVVAGTLTKFTLVLYGTATDSPSLSNQLESSGCKTLTPSQTCVGEYGAGREGAGVWDAGGSPCMH